MSYQHHFRGKGSQSSYGMGNHPNESYSDLFQNVNSGSVAPNDDTSPRGPNADNNATPMSKGEAHGSVEWIRDRKGVAGNL